MGARNTEARYGAVAGALHWLIALAIFANIALAFTFNDLMDHHSPARGGLVGLHESIGLSVLVLSLARLVWRLVNPVPALPADMSPGMKALAHASHYLLYALMILVPFLGWVLASGGPHPLLYFGSFAVPKLGYIASFPKPQQRPVSHIVGGVHEWLGYVLFFLALAHVCAALYHHFVRRDTVLKRMVPGTQAP